MSRSLDFSTPAAATSLATLAGETSRDPTTTTSLRAATATSATETSAANTSGSDRGIWAGDRGAIVVLLAGLGVGVAAVLL